MPEILTLSADNNLNIEPEFLTLVSESESGREQRRSKWDTPLHSYLLNFKNITAGEFTSLYNFFIDRRGQYEYFLWENKDESPITKFNRPKEEVTADYQQEDTLSLAHAPVVALSETIYDDDTPLVRDTDYLIDNNTGLITWLIKPASGSIITADYRFYRNVRFEEDKIPFKRTAFGVYNVQVKLREVRV